MVSPRARSSSTWRCFCWSGLRPAEGKPARTSLLFDHLADQVGVLA
jgi:hypothetical protein